MLLDARIRKMLVSGDPWACWHGFQLPISDEYICIWAPLGTKKHWKPNHWKPDFFYADCHTLTYIWPNKWFAIHISYTEDGKFSWGYCDVTLPAPDYTSETQDLIYTDLYVDVVIRADGSVFTKDQEVYERASQKYPVVAESRQKSFEVLDWLEMHAKGWTGPFEVMPRQLLRTNWEELSVPEVRELMRQSVEKC